MNKTKRFTPVTLEEFNRMGRTEPYKYELIDGTLIVSPKELPEHDAIINQFQNMLTPIIGGLGFTIATRKELHFDEDVIIPDLVIFHNTKPIIIIEVVTLDNISADYILKHRLYDDIGIKEYWIVNPMEKSVAIFNFMYGSEKISDYGQAESQELPQMQLSLNDIFA